MIQFFRTKSKNAFFSEEEQKEIVHAIQHAEAYTTGEVRLFVESKCKNADALQRAYGIFNHLRMDQTINRNAALIYIALHDKKLAIFGDEGIHQKAGEAFWNKELDKIIAAFSADQMIQGIIHVIKDVGEVLKEYFPDERETNKNELPDEIVFGS